MMVPMVDDLEGFIERFGCSVYTFFNMTELCTPIVSERNPLIKGSCGRQRPGVELKLVDENDCEVNIGDVGELVVRTNRPWAINHGYLGNPEATARAWRNGWFHTGDGFRQDVAGNFYFVDRMKDAIRRRGENISSSELEHEVLSFPMVREAAAIGVPSEFGEEDVMVVVSPVSGEQIDAEKLVRYLIPRMAHFMVPRYIRVMDDLPKTPTQKIKKEALRYDGVTADTWDREVNNIKVKRDRIG